MPLKPNPRSPRVPEKYKEAIRKAPDTLANFYPKGVFPYNIGTNEGVVHFLRQFFDDFILLNPEKKYYLITCDENIYKRAIRVHNIYISIKSICIPFINFETRQ